MKDKLYEKNIEMLFAWGKPDLKQNIKRSIRKYLLRQAVAPVDQWFWPQAMLADGIMAVISSSGCAAADREQGLAALDNYYDMWIKSGQKIYYVDNAMHGMTLLDLYELTGKEKYWRMAEKLVEYLESYPQDAEGNLSYRLKNPNLVFADSLGMICPFLCRYGQITGKQEPTELGVKQLLNFLKNGLDERSGLPYHGYDSSTGVKQGCIGWGRAVGWLLMGLCGSLNYLPEYHPQYAVLKQAAEQLEQTVWEYQRSDGGFSWLLPAVEGSADTSATGMIVGAVTECRVFGNKDELTAEIRSGHVKKSLEFVKTHLKNGNVDNASGECEGFGQYPQRYGVYPWGNGIVLKLIKKTEYSKYSV